MSFVCRLFINIIMIYISKCVRLTYFNKNFFFWPQWILLSCYNGWNNMLVCRGMGCHVGQSTIFKVPWSILCCWSLKQKFSDSGFGCYIELHGVQWNLESLDAERSECMMKSGYHCLLGRGVELWRQRMESCKRS